MTTIRIDGVDKVLARFDKFRPAVTGAIRAAGLHVKGAVAIYPPATDANRPGPYPKRWYKRGTGPFWALKGGGAHYRDTSEKLGQRWTVKSEDMGMTVIVGNNVSYGKYVQDEGYQSQAHQRHGWKTIQTVAREEAERVKRMVLDAIRRAMGLD